LTLVWSAQERFEALHTPLLNLIEDLVEDSHLGEELYSKRVDTRSTTSC